MSENVECTICTDFYSESLNDSFSLTECGHLFHHSCITTSLSRRPSCPTCRHGISGVSSLRSVKGVDPNRIPKKFTISTLGDAYIGKTGLVHRFADGDFNGRTTSTVVIDYKRVNIEVGGDPVNLLIQDTGGDYKFKAVTPQYIRLSHGIIIAYDCHRWETLQSVPDWVQFAKEHAPEAELVLIGCRSDVESCAICEKSGIPCRKPTKEEIEAVATSFGLFHFTTSAKTSEFVDVAFRTLASRIMENDPLLRHRGNNGSTIKLHERPSGSPTFAINTGEDDDDEVNCWGVMKQWFRKVFGAEEG